MNRFPNLLANALLLGVGTIPLAACAKDVTSRHHDIDLNGITQLDFSGAGEISLVQQSESASLQVRSERHDDIEIRREGDTLVIDVDDDVDEASFTLSGVSLNELDLSGGTRLRANGYSVPSLFLDISGGSDIEILQLQTDDLRIKSSGAADIKLTGTATRQYIDLAGASNYEAEQLKTQETTLDSSGASSVKVHAEKTLTIDSSGASSVEYSGSAAVSQDISGAGSVEKIGA